MKHSLSYLDETRSRPRKQLWTVFLIGLPVTSFLLIATQPNLQFQIDSWYDRTFHPLEKPYRYPFEELLSRNHSPMARLQQEIAGYQARIKANPKGGLDQASLAATYLRMARFTGEGSWYLLAQQTAQQSLANLAIDNSEAVLVLARVAEAGHDFKTALQLANQFSNQKDAIGLQVTVNLATGNLKAANQAVDRLVDLTLSQNAFLLQALVRTAQGKDQEALQSFQYALAVEEPGEISLSARTRTLLGRFYYERGQLDLAENLYREALHILPGNPQALLNLAQLEIRREQDAAADRHYAQLLSQSDRTVFSPLILRGQARLQKLRGNNAAANERWNKAETLLRQSFIGESNTNSFGHRRDLARLLLERGHEKDINEAVSLMQAEVKLRRDAETLDTFAWALSRAGRLQEAQPVIREAIAQGVRNPALFDRAATIEQALGNESQAKTYLQTVQTLDPQFNDRARKAWGLGAGLGS
jgi:tetratricopeptide (TPR) repeat protein